MSTGTGDSTLIRREFEPGPNAGSGANSTAPAPGFDPRIRRRFAGRFDRPFDAGVEWRGATDSTPPPTSAAGPIRPPTSITPIKRFDTITNRL